MSAEQIQLEAGIAALEAQRAVLGDAVVDAALAGLHIRLAALRATAAPEPEATQTQTLRQVSILFLDVVGSTTLSQRLDPEETSAVVDGLLRRATAIVQAHRGRVVQYAGDSILAVFGSEEAAEDDAERAVRCGLRLLELGRTLGAEVQAAHGHSGCDVRVGIHTGGVLLGGGGGGAGDESAIRGLAVNIAARMEQTAPSGALRISRDCYLQVRGMFEVAVQEPLGVKGVIDPIVSYLVRKAKPRGFRFASRGIEGVATQMVGRDAEFGALQDAFKRLFAERQLMAVNVVAEAGIGKSRLMTEFEAWTKERPERVFLFRGRATPQTQGQPFGLLRDIMAWRFHLSDDDTLIEAKAKIEQGLMPLFADEPDFAQGHAHLLGHLVGLDWMDSPHLRGILDDPKQIRSRAQHAAAQMFRRVSGMAGSPIILQLEDLQWADDESLDFLNYLAEVNGDVPMLMLAFTRPTLFERRSEWPAGGTRTEGLRQRIDLAPLDRHQSLELANQLLKRLIEIPAALRELITGRAEGNPFYMEELVRMLIDQGAINASTEPWQLHADKLLTTQVPATLTGVLQARLDGLPAPERLTLQEASVIGQVFWDSALFALDAQTQTTLPRLVQRELALPRQDAAADGLREYAFKHAILHQVTYGTVLKRQRKELHAKTARWLAQQTGPRAKGWLGTAAEHFELAGDDVNAAEFYARAAEYTASTFAHESALDYTKRALALMAEGDHELRWRLLAARERTLDLLGQREAQHQDIEALLTLAEILDDDLRRAEAASRRCDIAMRTSDYPTMEREAGRAQALAERAGNEKLALRELHHLAVAIAYQGDPATGRALAEAGLKRAELHADGGLQSLLANAAVICAELQGDRMACLQHALFALAMAHDSGNRLRDAVNLGNVGIGYAAFGDYATARQYIEKALDLNRAVGNRSGEGVNLIMLSDVALQLGECTQALILARAALDIAVAVGARFNQINVLSHLASAELSLGRFAEAAVAFERSEELALEINSTPLLLDALSGAALVALACQDNAQAVRMVERLLEAIHAVANAVVPGGLAGAGQTNPLAGAHEHAIRLTLCRVWSRAGDPRATGAISDAYRVVINEADRISDAALRHSFLTNVPDHNAIVKLWGNAANPSVGAQPRSAL